MNYKSQIEDYEEAIEQLKKTVRETTERFNNIMTVVRCKDCKKYGDNKKCPIEALINSDSKQFFAFDENWFCADGEKGTDDA